MALYGYHRTSTAAQKLDRGIIEIKEFGKIRNRKIKKIYLDKYSGKTFDRPNYNKLKERLKPGDELIVTEMDRLGRNKNQVLDELYWLRKNEIRIYILEIPTTLISVYSTEEDIIMQLTTNVLIEVYSSFAQIEMRKREKRQREGIEAMKLRGEWELYGRPRMVPREVFRIEYQKVLDGNLKDAELRNHLKLNRSTFSRYKKEVLKCIENIKN